MGGRDAGRARPGLDRCLRHFRTVRRSGLAVYVAAVFLVSRLVYAGLGVGFDASPLPEFWQYLDPELLRHDLVRSLVYLHSQPPLFNLFLGLVLKAGGAAAPQLFHGVYLVAGLVLSLTLLALMGRLRVPRLWALVLTTLFVIGPSAVLYENWLFYAFPLTVLLTGSALLLHETFVRPTGGHLLALFVVVGALVGTASPFHLAYYALVAAGVTLACRGRRRAAVVAAMVPLVPLVALYGSHLVLFGRFTTHSWVGMSAAKVTLRHVPMAERERLIAAGALSPLAAITPFAALEWYPEAYRHAEGYPAVPVLTQVRKSTGYTNFNHAAYLRIADQYLRDTLYAIRHYPGALLRGIGTAWLYYFRSTSDYAFFEANGSRVAVLAAFYDRWLYGRVPSPIAYALAPGDESHLYLTLLAGLPLLVAYGVRLGLRGRAAPDAESRVEGWVILYLCFNIVYVAGVANVLEVVENNRFRFMTEPSFLVLLGLVLRERPWRRASAPAGVLTLGRPAR